MAALSHKFGWLGYHQYYTYLVSCIQVIYIGNLPLMQTLVATPLRELLDRLKYLKLGAYTHP